MKSLINILILIVLVSGFGFASVIEDPDSDGGGKGGYPQEFSQGLSFPGMVLFGNILNDGKKVSCWFSGGLDNQTRRFDDAHMDFIVYDFMGDGFAFSASWRFRMGFEEESLLDFHENLNLNLQDIKVNSYLEASNLGWVWHQDTGEIDQIISDSTNLYYSFNLLLKGYKEHEFIGIRDFYLRADEYYSEEEGITYCDISLGGRGVFLPEPCTILLLSFGGLFIRQRRLQQLC